MGGQQQEENAHRIHVTAAGDLDDRQRIPRIYEDPRFIQSPASQHGDQDGDDAGLAQKKRALPSPGPTWGVDDLLTPASHVFFVIYQAPAAYLGPLLGTA